MDRFGEWRQIDPATDDEENKKPTGSEARPPAAGQKDLRFAGVLVAAVMFAVGGYVWLTLPSAPTGVTIAGQDVLFDSAGSPDADAESGASPAGDAEIVVDVQGAVFAPGLHRLRAGSRVGDAIAAAGGYSATIDIAAAASQLNLAERLVDGAKVHVPVRGTATNPAASFVPEQPGAIIGDAPVGSLVNLNTATSEQLDTLPGIGPVTAAKIIAAREAGPFATIDELVSREVIGPATLEKLRGLVTVGP